MKVKRRDFFRVLSATACGVAISILGLSKMKKRDVTVADKTQKQDQQVVMNFFPDEIVSSVVFHGRFFVCCRHSLWEVEEDCRGEFLQRKLIKYT